MVGFYPNMVLIVMVEVTLQKYWENSSRSQQQFANSKFSN